MVAFALTLRRAVEIHPMARNILLGCGIIGSAWWVAMDVVGSLRYDGYRYVDYSISELSAEGAPTRLFMTVASGIPYAVLMTAFGLGVWATAGESRAQRVTGTLVTTEVLWGVVGGIAFPMAPRGVEGTLRNDLHVIYGLGMPILFLLAIGFGSRLLGTRFRYFSYGTIVVMLVFGALTGIQGGKVPSGESTPYMGLEERINAYASMLWLAVLAVGLLRAQGVTVQRRLRDLATSVERMQKIPH